MALPPLRTELVLHPGPRDLRGQPTWTLQDPIRGRFFRLDWMTFEVVRHWSLGDPQAIQQRITATTPLHVSPGDVLGVRDFLAAHELLDLRGLIDAREWATQRARREVPWWKRVIHTYLFFRIPLFHPEPFLHALEKSTRWLFRAGFWKLTFAAFTIGLVLVFRQTDELLVAWRELATTEGLFLSALAILAVKVIHELGHGLAAVRYGCRVPTMGVAFLVLIPFAYTDVTDSWRLTDRRARLCIGAAGILAELTVAAWATLGWALLPDGGLRSAALVVGTVTWIKSLVINLSPLLRFDGYYLLSDLLELPNLHTRCFALARWQQREWLFALNEPPPERFPPGWHRGLIALGYIIWVYRLVVFLGIALFVYHYFFKALGLILFTIELAWFIVLPIITEVKSWLQRSDVIKRSTRAKKVAGAVLGLIVLIAIPLPLRVEVAAELRPAEEFYLVAPDSAVLTGPIRADGDQVASGEIIAVLRSPGLEFRRDQVQQSLARIEAALDIAAVQPGGESRLAGLQSERDAARAELEGIRQAIGQLQPTAPFTGILRWASSPSEGETLARQERFAVLVKNGSGKAVAYLSEEATSRLRPGHPARFYPDGATEYPLQLEVVVLESDASRNLDHPSLATANGGTVEARPTESGWSPTSTVYRVWLRSKDEDQALGLQVRRGKLILHAGWQPLGSRFLRHAMSVLWREAGF
jgi:putative peptide zinc metalloprotease protein